MDRYRYLGYIFGIILATGVAAESHAHALDLFHLIPAVKCFPISRDFDRNIFPALAMGGGIGGSNRLAPRTQ